MAEYSICFKIEICIKYLKKARPKRNYSDNEAKSAEDIIGVATVFSVSEISPTIVANVELKASKCLNLKQNSILNIKDSFKQCLGVF